MQEYNLQVAVGIKQNVLVYKVMPVTHEIQNII